MIEAREHKSAVKAWFREHERDLEGLSRAVFEYAELSLQEYKSAGLLASNLEQHGFSVERGVAGLETAFVGTYGGTHAGPTIAFVGEYDALPDVGHACGHNLIGVASLGAAIALRQVVDVTGGVVKMIGTPAEEYTGAKLAMADAGVFGGLDAALMFHPAAFTAPAMFDAACCELTVEFFGVAAHAATDPHKGINALDACILTFNNVNALRQHISDGTRIHGIITHGGTKPNIIPEYAAAEIWVRARSDAAMLDCLERVKDCARAGALAAGARASFADGNFYPSMVPNSVLARLFSSNLQPFGFDLDSDIPESARAGSTDMGRVSTLVPSLHAWIAIAPPTVALHSKEFRDAAGSAAGFETMVQVAQALAMTGVDLLCDPALVAQVWNVFDPSRATFHRSSSRSG